MGRRGLTGCEVGAEVAAEVGAVGTCCARCLAIIASRCFPAHTPPSAATHRKMKASTHKRKPTYGAWSVPFCGGRRNSSTEKKHWARTGARRGEGGDASRRRSHCTDKRQAGRAIRLTSRTQRGNVLGNVVSDSRRWLSAPGVPRFESQHLGMCGMKGGGRVDAQVGQWAGGEGKHS